MLPALSDSVYRILCWKYQCSRQPGLADVFSSKAKLLQPFEQKIAKKLLNTLDILVCLKVC